MRVGKKFTPDPSRRTGFFAGPGQTEIGNKSLLRFCDSILNPESTRGFPAVLENTDIKGVFDIAQFLPPPLPEILIFDTDSEPMAGSADHVIPLVDPLAAGAVFQPTFNVNGQQFQKLLGVDVTINWGAAPIDNSRLQVRWNLVSYISAAKTPVQIDGGDILVPLILDADVLVHKIVFGAVSSGADGGISVPAICAAPRWNGTFRPPINAAGDGGLGMEVEIGYRSLTGAPPDPVFPAGTTRSVKMLLAQYPIRSFPVNL